MRILRAALIVALALASLQAAAQGKPVQVIDESNVTWSAKDSCDPTTAAKYNVKQTGDEWYCSLSSADCSPSSPPCWILIEVGSASAGGSNTHVQFNCSGALCGDDGLTYVEADEKLTVGSGAVGVVIDPTSTTPFDFDAGTNRVAMQFHGSSSTDTVFQLFNENYGDGNDGWQFRHKAASGNLSIYDAGTGDGTNVGPRFAIAPDGQIVLGPSIDAENFDPLAAVHVKGRQVVVDSYYGAPYFGMIDDHGDDTELRIRLGEVADGTVDVYDVSNSISLLRIERDLSSGAGDLRVYDDIFVSDNIVLGDGSGSSWSDAPFIQGYHSSTASAFGFDGSGPRWRIEDANFRVATPGAVYSLTDGVFYTALVDELQFSDDGNKSLTFYDRSETALSAKIRATDSPALVLSAEGGTIYLRPEGDLVSDYQTSVSSTGDVTITGNALRIDPIDGEFSTAFAMTDASLADDIDEVQFKWGVHGSLFEIWFERFSKGGGGLGGYTGTGFMLAPDDSTNTVVAYMVDADVDDDLNVGDDLDVGGDITANTVSSDSYSYAQFFGVPRNSDTANFYPLEIDFNNADGDHAMRLVWVWGGSYGSCVGGTDAGESCVVDAHCAGGGTCSGAASPQWYIGSYDYENTYVGPIMQHYPNASGSSYTYFTSDFIDLRTDHLDLGVFGTDDPKYLDFDGSANDGRLFYNPSGATIRLYPDTGESSDYIEIDHTGSSLEMTVFGDADVSGDFSASDVVVGADATQGTATFESGGGPHVTMKANDAMSSSHDFVLPVSTGAAGNCLKTSGATGEHYYGVCGTGGGGDPGASSCDAIPNSTMTATADSYDATTTCNGQIGGTPCTGTPEPECDPGYCTNCIGPPFPTCYDDSDCGACPPCLGAPTCEESGLYTPDRAVDSDDDTYWQSTFSAGNSWIKLAFAVERSICAFTYDPQSASAGCKINDFTFEVSSNGSDWSEPTNQSASSLCTATSCDDPITITFDHETGVNYVRLTADSVVSGTDVCAGEFSVSEYTPPNPSRIDEITLGSEFNNVTCTGIYTETDSITDAYLALVDNDTETVFAAFGGIYGLKVAQNAPYLVNVSTSLYPYTYRSVGTTDVTDHWCGDYPAANGLYSVGDRVIATLGTSPDDYTKIWTCLKVSEGFCQNQTSQPCTVSSDCAAYGGGSCRRELYKTEFTGLVP